MSYPTALTKRRRHVQKPNRPIRPQGFVDNLFERLGNTLKRGRSL